MRAALTVSALAIGLALIVCSVQQYRVMVAQRGLSEVRSEYMAKVAAAQAEYALAMEEARRIERETAEKERWMRDVIDELEREASDAKLDRDVRLAAADDVVAGLQSDLANLAGAARDRGSDGPSATPAAQCDAAYETIRVLADMRRGSAARAVERAQFADDAHAAGLTCIAAYNAVKDVDRARATVE